MFRPIFNVTITLYPKNEKTMFKILRPSQKGYILSHFLAVRQRN